MNKDDFFKGYLECALWTEEENIDDAGLASSTILEMRSECDEFVNDNAELMEGLEPELCGHDFWLTRNGHGTGLFRS